MTDKPSDIFGSISISPDQEPAAPKAPKGDKAAKKKKAPAGKPPRSTRPQRQEPPARKSRQPRRRGRGLFFWLFILAVLFGLYSAAGYLLVPYLIKEKLPGFLAGKTGAELAMGKVSFNPYNFKLVLRDISLETVAAGQPRDRFLTADDLRINLDFLSLLRGELTCSELRMERGKLHLVRNQDKSYNISYLLNAPSLQNRSEIIDFAELPFLFSFNNISITESRVIIDDEISRKQHVIKDIELALPVISNFPYQTDSYIHPRFSAVINGSPVSLTGEAALGTTPQAGRQTQLSADINNIDIPLYFDYLPLTLPINISKGTANGVLQLTFSPEENRGSRFKIHFNLETTDLSLESRDAKLSLSMPAARLEGSFEPFSRELSFKSILLGEPAVVTDVSENAPMAATLRSIAPMALRPAPDHKLYPVIPPIDIELLIAEGGSFTVREAGKKSPVQQWKNVQLSIKNFTNDRLLPTTEEGSFRLSGEDRSSPAFFTWQGSFDNQNHPGGNLQLANFPASIIAPFLGRGPGDVSGTADLTGLLSLDPTEKEDTPFDYTLKSTKLAIKDLEIREGGTAWLKSPSMRCDPVSRIKGITDLGNIYLQNSLVRIDRNKLPYLFLVFSARPTQHLLHGIDFSGSVAIEGGTNKPSFQLKDVVFQANKLEKQEAQKDNFVLTANLGTSSEIKAKGGLQVAPFQINTRMSATNLAPAQLFSWFSDSKSLNGSKGNLSVQGTFLYPEQEFSGDLAADNVVLATSQKDGFKAATVGLNEFTWSKTRRSLTVKKLLVDQPSFTWYRLDKEKDPLTRTADFLRSLLLPEAGSDPSPDRFSAAVDEINIANGSITYIDERTKPTLRLTVNGINGELLDLQAPETKSKGEITLNGAIEGYPFRLEGQGKLLLSPADGTTTFSASSLPLKLFSEQIKGRVKGVDTDEVTVDIVSTVDWDPLSPSREVALSLHNLVPETPGTGLATAFAILSGNGTTAITIKDDRIPTRFILDEALDSFSRTMIKASINPLLLADPKFVDLAEKDSVTFQPGTDQFTVEGIEQLNRYGELLAAYPLIDLKISGLSDPEKDVEVLLDALKKAEQVRVDVENRKRALEWEKKQELERMKLDIWPQSEDEISESDIPVVEDQFKPISPQPVQVTNRELNELGLRREQAVVEYLVEQLSIDPDRLIITSENKQGIVSGGDAPKAVIRLTDGYERLSRETEPGENQPGSDAFPETATEGEPANDRTD